MVRHPIPQWDLGWQNRGIPPVIGRDAVSFRINSAAK
jgi:hypothetical protein